MKCIAFSGQKRYGKDVCSDYLAEKIGWERTAFANNVKQIFMDAFGVDSKFIEKWKVTDEIPPGFDMDIRNGLRFIGNGFRQIVSSIWIDLIFRKMKKPSIISDTRYVNELKATRENGGINVLLYREGYLNFDECGSESQIRPFVEWMIAQDPKKMEGVGPFEDSNFPEISLIDVFIYNDGTLDDLYEKIDKIVLPYVEHKFGEQKCQKNRQLKILFPN